MLSKIFPYGFFITLIFIIVTFIVGNNIISKLLIAINIVFILYSLVFYKYSKKVLILLVINFLIMLLLISNRFPSFDFISYKNIKSDGSGVKRVELSNMNNVKPTLESLTQDITIDIKNNVSRDIVIDKINYAIDYGSSLLNKDNPKSYLDLAHIYELAVIYNISDQNSNYTSKTLEVYNEYCVLEPNDPECYASIARFLILDKSKKKEAIPFALKALELARNADDIDKYNSLVNYIEKL